MKRTALALVLVAAGATAASAEGPSGRSIDGIQARQESRISQGIRNGSLTRQEAANLQAEQRRIQQMENRAKADGHVSRREYFGIRQAQQQARRHIAQESHDSQSRRRWTWWR